MRDHVVFYLNGVRQEVGADRAGWMLADFLRVERGLTGTKIVCAEGDCGACTVLRYVPTPSVKAVPVERARFLPVNSCITPVAQMDGSTLITVEGLSKEDAKLTPVQQAMVQCHGSQCGFCTPGFVMALTALVEKRIAFGSSDSLTAAEAKNALTGNLCRCTGYQPILQAAESIDVGACDPLWDRYYPPKQAKELKAVWKKAVEIEGEGFTFFAPTALKDALAYLKKYKDARVLTGATDLGVLHNKWKQRLQRVLSLHLVSELYSVTGDKGRIKVGSRVTLSELRWIVKESIPEFSRFLDLFASPQIKNVATLAGNVGNASPIADTPPFLLVAGAVVHTAGPKGKRQIPLEKYYLGYRKTALAAGEIITALEFDVPEQLESLALYKVSQRKDLDISTVNAAFRVSWDEGRIASARVAFGGMAATPLRLPKTEKAMVGVDPGKDLEHVLEALHAEMSPLSDLRGSSAYRRVVAENLVRRFFREKAGHA